MVESSGLWSQTACLFLLLVIAIFAGVLLLQSLLQGAWESDWQSLGLTQCWVGMEGHRHLSETTWLCLLLLLPSNCAVLHVTCFSEPQFPPKMGTIIPILQSGWDVCSSSI